jgi:hypothetical protein
VSEKILLIGIKCFIKDRKKRIAIATDPRQIWNDKSYEIPAKLARAIAEHMSYEIEYFETILKASKKHDSERTKKSL